MDKFDKEFYSEIQNRKESKESYEILFNRKLYIGLSKDEARKQLKGIENYLNFKLENIPEINSKKYPEKKEQTENYIKAERIFTREPQSLEDVQEMFQVNSKIWECSKFTVSSWDVTAPTVGVTATNYAVKAEFKKRQDIINYQELLEKFINDTKGYVPIQAKYEYKEYNSGNLLEINIQDLHLGKLGWGEEVGEDYDHKIAESRFFEVINDHIERSKNKKIDKILFIFGSDFFNSDGITGNTTKGTKQDNDLRWQKMFNKGCEIMVRGIDMMLKLAPIDILYVPGNHDFEISYYANMYLSAWFRNCNDVNIDISPATRKYYRWGNCLIGFSHGSEEKGKIGGLMQIEACRDWGETIFKEWHLGHLHSEQTKEENGIIIRNISSITGSDSWHKNSGYVGAIKKAPSFLWNKEKGLLTIENSIILSGGAQ